MSIFWYNNVPCSLTRGASMRRVNVIGAVAIVAILTPLGEAAVRIKVDGGDVPRHNAPVVAVVKADLPGDICELKPAGEGTAVMAQVQRTGDETVLRWIEP